MRGSKFADKIVFWSIEVNYRRGLNYGVDALSMIMTASGKAKRNLFNLEVTCRNVM